MNFSFAGSMIYGGERLAKMENCLVAFLITRMISGGHEAYQTEYKMRVAWE